MDTTRTFIIFTTLFCVWAGPISPHDKPILKLISEDKEVCNFPPREVLVKPTKAPYILSCNNKQIPDYRDFGVGLEGIQAYANATQDNDALLCMGLYDLSLQLCKASVPKAALPTDAKQFNSLFNDQTGDDTFCKNIQSYVDQHTSFPITSDWLTVLNANLKTESNCKNVCTSMRNGKLKVRPICKIILWGRHLLHDISSSQPIPQPRKLPTVEGELSHEQLHDSDTYADPGDLEAKDTEVTDSEKSTSTGKVLDISMPQKTEPSNTLVSGLKELSNPTTKEQTPSVEQPVINPKDSNVSPSFETSRVVAIEPKNDISIQVANAVEQVKKSEESKLENVAIEPASGGPVIKSSTTIGQSSSSPSSSPQQESVPLPDQKSYSEPENTVQDTLTTDSEEQYAEQQVDDTAATFQNIDQADEDDDDFDQPEINHRKQPQGMRTNTFPESDMESHLFGSSTFKDAEDSHFFAYFLTLALICILAYLAFHNKNKILALVLEGRRGGASRGGRSSRRPSTSSYRKLDSTLEEAISSAAPRTNPHVIY